MTMPIQEFVLPLHSTFEPTSEQREKIRQLEAEGFTNVVIIPTPPNRVDPPHSHPIHTVQIFLKGGVIVTDMDGTVTRYKEGERVEFPAGTVHIGRGTTDDGRMIIGVRG